MGICIYRAGNKKIIFQFLLRNFRGVLPLFLPMKNPVVSFPLNSRTMLLGVHYYQQAALQDKIRGKGWQLQPTGFFCCCFYFLNLTSYVSFIKVSYIRTRTENKVIGSPAQHASPSRWDCSRSKPGLHSWGAWCLWDSCSCRIKHFNVNMIVQQTCIFLQLQFAVSLGVTQRVFISLVRKHRLILCA